MLFLVFNYLLRQALFYILVLEMNTFSFKVDVPLGFSGERRSIENCITGSLD